MLARQIKQYGTMKVNHVLILYKDIGKICMPNDIDFMEKKLNLESVEK